MGASEQFRKFPRKVFNYFCFCFWFSFFIIFILILSLKLQQKQIQLMSCSLFFSSLAGEFSPLLALHDSLICRVSKKFSLDIFYLMCISRHLVVSSSCLLNIFWNGTEDTISSSSSTKHVRTCCCHVIWANSTNPPRIILLLALFLSFLSSSSSSLSICRCLANICRAFSALVFLLFSFLLSGFWQFVYSMENASCSMIVRRGCWERQGSRRGRGRLSAR